MYKIIFIFLTIFLVGTTLVISFAAHEIDLKNLLIIVIYTNLNLWRKFVMYQNIEGIDIGDYSYDAVCLNCQYWIIDGIGGGGMICGHGKGFTNPDDTCSMFRALNSMDDDYNSYLNKSQKMEIWKSHP